MSSRMSSKIEQIIRKYICMKIQQMVSKNKNNILLREILVEIAKEYECGVET